jgi:hypothetical protein
MYFPYHLSDLGRNFFLNNKATAEVPIKVAVQYSHKFVITPETTAGDRERAGFIEAPDINAKKNISRPTIPPITIPLNPFRPCIHYYEKLGLVQHKPDTVKEVSISLYD